MDTLLILRGGRVAIGPDEAVECDVEVAGRVIRSLGKAGKPPRGAKVLDLSGHVIMPGLINAHDHLEFNLYSRLGRGTYRNAGGWAREVYRPDESPIKEQLRIPKGIRLIWGGLKNLLSGVTTVCHHNPRNPAVFDRNFPVRVVKRFGWAHSLEFSPDLKARFQMTPPDWPFIIHLGEGVDRTAKQEIFQLDKLGTLDRRTVLVHAIGLYEAGLRLAKERGASIIWCPSSNLFLFGRTLSERALASGVPIALGSDSALTADGDLLDELKVARKVSGLSSSVLYRMVTTDAAQILRLRPGRAADLVAFPDGRRSPSSALLRANRPELVVIGGKVKLISPGLAHRFPTPRLHTLQVEGRGEFFVDADIPRLYERARRALGNEIRLAGRRLSV